MNCPQISQMTQIQSRRPAVGRLGEVRRRQETCAERSEIQKQHDLVEDSVEDSKIVAPSGDLRRTRFGEFVL